MSDPVRKRAKLEMMVIMSLVIMSLRHLQCVIVRPMVHRSPFWHSRKCAPSSGSRENHVPEQLHLSTNKNSCYYPFTIAIVRHLRWLFLKNRTELTTLNDVGPAVFS